MDKLFSYYLFLQISAIFLPSSLISLNSLKSACSNKLPVYF
nr:MAG TPA: hypothetical protein [Bacteriophage sp.]